MTDKQTRLVQKYSDEIMNLIITVKEQNLTAKETIGIAEAIIIKVLQEK